MAAHDRTAPRPVAGVGMFYASVIVVGYLILREAWTSFYRSKLSFDFYRPSIRGVLYHGFSPRSVVRFVYLTSAIQAMLSYSAGVAITIFVLVPLLSYYLRDTFFVFLVSRRPGDRVLHRGVARADRVLVERDVLQSKDGGGQEMNGLVVGGSPRPFRRIDEDLFRRKKYRFPALLSFPNASYEYFFHDHSRIKPAARITKKDNQKVLHPIEINENAFKKPTILKAGNMTPSTLQWTLPQESAFNKQPIPAHATEMLHNTPASAIVRADLS